MGSVAAGFRGADHGRWPPSSGAGRLSGSADVYGGAGHMGHAYEPVKGNELPGRVGDARG